MNTAPQAAQRYQLVKIPLGLNVSVDVEAASLDEVRQFAMSNIDTSTRWIVKKDGRNIGEAIEVTRYRFDDARMKVVPKIFNSTATRVQYFDTPEAAAADYRAHCDEASRQLDAVVHRLEALKAELSCDLGYVIKGDTHGIDEDYLYVSVNVGGYEYRRQL